MLWVRGGNKIIKGDYGGSIIGVFDKKFSRYRLLPYPLLCLNPDRGEDRKVQHKLADADLFNLLSGGPFRAFGAHHPTTTSPATSRKCPSLVTISRSLQRAMAAITSMSSPILFPSDRRRAERAPKTMQASSLRGWARRDARRMMRALRRKDDDRPPLHPRR